MADRTVRVRLSANVNDYTRDVDKAARKTDELRRKAERFDGSQYGADFDAKTKGAEASIDRLKAKAEGYDGQRYSARFTANSDEIKRAQEDLAKSLDGMGRQQKKGLLSSQIAQTKKELAELNRFAAGHTPKLDLDIKAAERKREQLRRSLKALEDGKTDPRIELNIKKAEAQRNELRRKLRDLAKERISPVVSADIKRAEADLGLVELKLKELRASRNKPAVAADIAQFKRDMAVVDDQLARLRAKRVTPKIGARIEELERQLAVAQAELDKIDGQNTQAKIDADTAKFNRKVEIANAKAEELERKRVMRAEAETSKAQLDAARLKEAYDRAQGVWRARFEAEYEKAWLDALKLKEANEQAAKDRRAKIDADFGKATAEAKALNSQLNNVSRNRIARITPSFGKASRELALINRQLNEASGNHVSRLSLLEQGNVRDRLARINDDMRVFGNSKSSGTVGLNGSEGVRNRMRQIMGAVMAFAPAVTASSSAAGASLVSLTTILMGGVAVAGAGFMAFKGLGDALKASLAYESDRSSENLKKLNEQLKGAGKETRSFVEVVGKLGPLMKEMQNTARAKMFPGLQAGIEAALGALPVMNDLVSRSSEALGRLGQSAGESLGSPFWKDYFTFLGAEAVPAFEMFMRAMGNITKGIAGLQIAMQPFTEDFVNGFDRMARSFALWSEGLGTNTEFQQWLQYVRDIGPKVMSTLESIAQAMGAMGKAMQPIAPIVLELMTQFADLITTIMSSPLGPALMGIVAAMGMMRVGALLLKATGLAALFRGISAAALALRAGAGGMAAMTAGMMAMGRGGKAGAAGAAAVGGASTKAAGSAGKFGGALGKLGGMLPGIGLVLVGAAIANDALNTSFSEGLEIYKQGGKASAELTTELQRNSAASAEAKTAAGGYASYLGYDWVREHIFGIETLESFNKKLGEQKASMGAAANAQMESQRAQTELNEAISRYGPGSQQAIDASNRLKDAQANVELQTELNNKVGKDYYETLGRLAQQAGPVGDAARRLASGLGATELAAAGASIQIDKTGKAVAVMPDGKRIDIKADTATSMGQLQAIAASVVKVPAKKDVNVGVISDPAMKALQSIGFEVKRLKNGEVIVTAKDDQARAKLAAFTQFADAQRANPKINADPALAFSEMARFINEANAKVGLPKIDANTADGRAKILGFLGEANAMRAIPGVDANTNPAVAKIQGWFNQAGAMNPYATLSANGAPAYGTSNAWNGHAGSLGPWATLNANGAPAFGTSNNWNAASQGLNPFATLSATGSPAIITADQWRGYAQGLNPTPNINANGNPATQVADQFLAHAQGLAPRPNINASAVPADGVANAWNAGTQGLRPMPGIFANDAAAAGTSRAWDAGTAGLRPTPSIFANNSNAMGAGNEVVNSFDGRTITMTIRANKVGFAEGGPVAGYATGGPVRSTRTLSTGRVAGAGSGTSDDVAMKAANGEWVIKARVARMQGAAKMTDLNAGRADITPRLSKGGDISTPRRVMLPPGFIGGGAAQPSGPTVNNNVTVHNPVAERSSMSVHNELARLGTMGLFG